MIDEDMDDGAQWRNEYEEWASEQEAKDMDAIARLLRAAGEGTVYDPRNHNDRNPT